MGWAILILLAVATCAILLIAARPGRGPAELVVAMLLLAVAGYAWQGNPTYAGRPTPPKAGRAPYQSLFAEERTTWFGKVGGEAQLLDSADTFIAKGDAAYAVGILRGALSRRPASAPLWTGFGNALVAYADGAVTPPARFAFTRAAALSPRNAGPIYFLGLAYAQAGDLDNAEKLWRSILADAPADAPWRLPVGEKLMLLDQIRAMPAGTR